MRRSTVAALCLALASLAAPAAAATAVLDQEQQSFNGSVSSPPSAFMAQTITAGLTGTLERASLRVANFASHQTLTLEIRDVTANGEPGGNVLASQAVFFPTPNTAWQTVDFEFAPATAVSAGTQYALVLRSSGEGNFTSNGYAWLGSSDPLSYPKGGTWLFFAGTWHPIQGFGDFVFQTFVAPPLSITVGLAAPSLNTQRRCLDVDSNGVVPTVIFGSSTFDVSAIDVSSVRLAGAGVAVRNNGAFMVALEDDNGDGIVDWKAKFRMSQMDLSPTDTSVGLTGSLKTGEKLTGSAPLGPCQ